MKKIILAFIFLLTAFASYAGWVNLNTGINDNLTGVVFWGNKGLVAGGHGIYYTTNGGSGPSSWTRFNISTNHNDSVLYNRTKFRHAYEEPSFFSSNRAFVCGVDTVANRAVIMLINYTAFTYSVVYTGTANSGGFNSIYYTNTDNSYYFVGDNGLMARVNSAGTSVSLITTPYNFNFSSITFYSNQFCIGAPGNLISGTLSAGVYTFTNNPSPSNNFSGVYSTSLYSCYAVGNNYSRWTGTVTQNSNYDFGPLNASGLHCYNNTFYVGTDHGIFKSTSNFSVLEWQPTSLSYSISNIWRNNALSSAAMYACGKNGVVLTTADDGGTTKPYASLSCTGGCVNATSVITGVTGSSSNCKWYINNVLVNSGCNSPFNYVYNAIGQYTVQLTLSNGTGLYDTAVQVIHIVDPVINKPVSLNKTVVCHQEPVVITIGASEPNVFYTLRQFGNMGNYGSSSPGNGSAITFTSTSFPAGGNFYLQASSTLASCSKNFTDTIKIAVEKTLADFHYATLNAQTNETLTCFENSVDAQNFKWTFFPAAVSSNLTVSTPTVAFSTAGPTQIKLVAWSNHGCYDSIQKPGPLVYTLPAVTDSCWTLLNNDPYLLWSGYQRQNIEQLSPSRSGFLTCGLYYDQVFPSNYSDSLYMPPLAGGGYLAKYDKNGTIKWMVSSRQTALTTSSQRDFFSSVVEDKTGNIYACGMTSSFKDNTGRLYINTSYKPLICKLDSTGKVIWRVENNVMNPQKIAVDGAGDVYILSGNFFSVPSGTFSLNGAASYPYINVQSQSKFQIFKFSASGNFLWSNSISPDGVNWLTQTGMTFDKFNNFYVTGNMEGYVNLYVAPGSTGYQTLSGPANNNSKLFVAKYNSNGFLQWKMKAVSQDPSASSFGNIYPYSSCTDSLGNTYIAGANIFGGILGIEQIFYNTNGSTTSTPYGTYYVAKINSMGVCKWIQSSEYAYYGYGYAVSEKGNEISVLGQISANTNSVSIITNTFTSADNHTITTTISEGDYFVAVYDTLGNIKKIIKNGNNYAYAPGTEKPFTGFYKTQEGLYRLSRNFRETSPYINFGDILPPTNNFDGSITTFSENCGIVTTSLSVSCVTPSMSVTNSAVICSGGTGTLTASGATTYSWSPAVTLSSGTGPVVMANPLSTIVYTVVGANAACMALNTVTVNVQPSLVLSVASVSTCIGNPVTLTVTGAASYTWTNPSSNSSTVSVNPVSTSAYTVNGTSPGCPSTYSTTGTVVVYPLPLISVNQPTICAGTATILSASGASSYTWAPGGLHFANIAVDPTTVPLTYTVSGTSSAGCSSSTIANVFVNPNPSIVVTSSGTVVCSGQPVILTASGAASYVWTNGIMNGVAFTPTVTNQYTVTGSANSCTNTATMLITVYNCTGLEEHTSGNEIRVYPNPSTDLVFIDGLGEAAVDIQLSNQLGQTMHCNYHQGSISLNGLAEGMYYLMIYKDHTLYYQAKLFKE